MELSNFIMKEQSIFITFLSDDTAFYDSPTLFFETEGVTVEHEPFIGREKGVKEFRRKLGTFQLCGKSARVSVLKSEVYGAMIKVSFIN